MGRASPLPPEERRAAIMAATEQLIVRKAGSVSTAAIARAAGIAEGTIFRVFPTKEAIIDAIFEDAFNAETRRAEIDRIDKEADLEARLVALVGVLQRRMRRIQALFAAVGFRVPPSMRSARNAAPGQMGLADVGAMFEPDSGRLRVPPPEAARLLFSIVMALNNPMFGGRPDIEPEEIVNLLLNGIAIQPALPPRPKGPSC